jgi:hypothetical protein
VRKKLKNLKNKSGHSENGAPRQLIDEATYREHHTLTTPMTPKLHYDTEFSGFSNATRPRDQAISLRSPGFGRQQPPPIG